MPDSTSPFSLEARNPPGLKQDLTYFALNSLFPGIMAVLRRAAPVWRIPRTDVVVVTGFDAVQEVFSRHHDFHVPYEERVRILGWPHFVLALQDTDEYHEMHDHMAQLWRSEDLSQVRRIAAETAAGVLASADDEIDLIQQLVKPVLLAVVEQYYGVPVPADRAQPFFDGNLASSGFMFSGPRITQKQITGAQAAMRGVWPVIDHALARARRDPDGSTVLGRYILEGQDKTFPEPLMRSAVMAMIGGFLPTDTNASGRIMEVLLRRPEAMAFALDAAGDGAGGGGDDGRLLTALLEALRVDYIIPILWRRAVNDTVIGEGTRKLRPVRQGSILAVSLQSAMKDRRRIPNPRQFDPTRSPAVRMVYGHAFHYCVGESISNTVLLEIFKAVLARRPTRSRQRPKTRWAGDYPWNLWLELRPMTPVKP